MPDSRPRSRANWNCSNDVFTEFHALILTENYGVLVHEEEAQFSRSFYNFPLNSP